MGHSIHKHMNSFKAKNLLSEMPIDNKASALEMDKGSAAYMKDDMAPKMEKGSPALHKGDHKKLSNKEFVKHFEDDPYHGGGHKTIKKK